MKRLIKTYVRSVAAYEYETWVINRIKKKKKEIFKM